MKSKHKIVSSEETGNAPKNKKLKFDEDGEIETRKKPKLLESDEEDEEFKFPDDSEVTFKSKTKLSKLQSAIGNDDRFIVDERFLEDEDLEEDVEKEEETDEFSEEKKKQLEILGNILGKPIPAKEASKIDDEKDEKSTRIGQMVRYDPTNEQHQEYEVVTKNPEKVKKKKKKEIEEVIEPEPVTVSKDIFYSVSDNLADAIKEKEQFSLLQAFGKESDESNIEKSEALYECDQQKKSFGFNFNKGKAFKYDSSDDEEEKNDSFYKSGTNKFKSQNEDFSNANSDRFFFAIDDPRFFECEEFFKNRSERNEDLRTLRPLLKQTIRKRIRTNLKKHSTAYKKLKKRKY